MQNKTNLLRGNVVKYVVIVAVAFSTVSSFAMADSFVPQEGQSTINSASSKAFALTDDQLGKITAGARPDSSSSKYKSTNTYNTYDYTYNADTYTWDTKITGTYVQTTKSNSSTKTRQIK